METEPFLPKLNKIIGAIEDEGNYGVHVIEIDERPEIIEVIVDVMRAFFEYSKGDFYNLVKADGVLNDIPDGLSLELAEEKSTLLYLAPKDGKKRTLKYRIETEATENGEGNHRKTRTKAIELMKILSQNGEQDEIELKDLNQKTFAVLAGLLATPLISQYKKRKRIGILFDGSLIDVQNWKSIFEYLKEFSHRNSLSVFLFILRGKIGNYFEVFSKSVNRIGIYSSKAFIPTNSYEKSLEIVHRMSDSLKSSILKIPLVLFIGAGASMEAGFTPTEELMLGAIRRIVKEKEFSKEPEELKASLKNHIIAGRRLIEGETENNVQITFERVMTEELNFCQNTCESPTLNLIYKTTKELAASAAHYCLSNLSKTEFKPIFLTTNYDDLLEKSLDSFAPIVIYKEADFDLTKVSQTIKEYVEGDGKKVPVIKFHGTINDFDSIKASVEHTRTLENHKHNILCSLLNGNLFRGIISEFKNSVVRIVFIGYGFNDLDISSALYSVLQNEHNLHTFAVNPNPTRNTLLFLESASRRNISVNYMNNLISVPFSIFAGELENSAHG
jgi:hypothetical protein